MGADFLHAENGLPSRQQNPDSNARHDSTASSVPMHICVNQAGIALAVRNRDLKKLW